MTAASGATRSEVTGWPLTRATAFANDSSLTRPERRIAFERVCRPVRRRSRSWICREVRSFSAMRSSASLACALDGWLACTFGVVMPTAARTTRMISCGGWSLETCAAAPVARARSRMPGSRVRKTILVCGRLSRSMRATSRPVMPGIELSRTIRSGRSSSALRAASFPSAASPTTLKSGSGSMSERRPSRTARWSSAMRIRFGTRKESVFGRYKASDVRGRNGVCPM